MNLERYYINGISQVAADNGSHEIITAVRAEDVPRIVALELRLMAREFRNLPDVYRRLHTKADEIDNGEAM